MKIGFVGLGNMGAGMAANLLEAGHEVTAYNRSQDKVAALAENGAKAARSVAEACGGDIVITMLANDDAVEAVTFGDDGILASLPRRHPRLVEHDQRRARREADRRACFGRPRVCGSAGLRAPGGGGGGQAVRVAAGGPAAVQALPPVFDAIGQRTFVVAEDPKAASLVKLSGNFLIASVIEALGEAMALVSKAGVDKQEYLELLTSTLFGAPVYKTYGGLIAREEFEPAGFAASLGLKDVRLVLAAGEALQVPLPVASLVRDRFLTLLANGGADLDWSALGKVAAWEAGSQKTD